MLMKRLLLLFGLGVLGISFASGCGMERKAPRDPTKELIPGVNELSKPFAPDPSVPRNLNPVERKKKQIQEEKQVQEEKQAQEKQVQEKQAQEKQVQEKQPQEKQAPMP
jgi:hypothetical protein